MSDRRRLAVDQAREDQAAVEVLDALPDPCPHCPHPLSEHFRGEHMCMASREDEPWACDCNGPTPADGGRPGVP